MYLDIHRIPASAARPWWKQRHHRDSSILGINLSEQHPTESAVRYIIHRVYAIFRLGVACYVWRVGSSWCKVIKPNASSTNHSVLVSQVTTCLSQDNQLVILLTIHRGADLTEDFISRASHSQRNLYQISTVALVRMAFCAIVFTIRLLWNQLFQKKKKKKKVGGMGKAPQLRVLQSLVYASF